MARGPPLSPRYAVHPAPSLHPHQGTQPRPEAPMTDIGPRMSLARCGCGGEAEIVGPDNGGFAIECNKCHFETCLYDDEKALISTWNLAMSGEARLREAAEAVCNSSDYATDGRPLMMALRAALEAATMNTPDDAEIERAARDAAHIIDVHRERAIFEEGIGICECAECNIFRAYLALSAKLAEAERRYSDLLISWAECKELLAKER